MARPSSDREVPRERELEEAGRKLRSNEALR